MVTGAARQTARSSIGPHPVTDRGDATVGDCSGKGADVSIRVNTVTGAPDPVRPLVVEHDLVREVIDRFRMVRRRADRLPAVNLRDELVATIEEHLRSEERFWATWSPSLGHPALGDRPFGSDVRTYAAALNGPDVDPLGPDLDDVLTRIERSLVEEEALLFELFSQIP